jgi:uncharacterized protein (DUF305 family)
VYTVSRLRRALLPGLAVLLLAAGCGDNMGGMNHGGSGQTSSPAPAGAEFNDADVEFAQMMVPHHQQAVEMAALAETRASDPEVKQLAAQIKGAQDPEIRTMLGWLATWKQPSAMAGHDMSGMPGMMSGQDMTALKNATGKDFDRKFATMMIAHHEGAIEMAREEQAKGKHAEAKALAATIEKAQTAEIATLKKIVERLK